MCKLAFYAFATLLACYGAAEAATRNFYYLGAVADVSNTRDRVAFQTGSLAIDVDLMPDQTLIDTEVYCSGSGGRCSWRSYSEAKYAVQFGFLHGLRRADFDYTQFRLKFDGNGIPEEWSYGGGRYVDGPRDHFSSATGVTVLGQLGWIPLVKSAPELQNSI